MNWMNGNYKTQAKACRRGNPLVRFGGGRGREFNRPFLPLSKNYFYFRPLFVIGRRVRIRNDFDLQDSK